MKYTYLYIRHLILCGAFFLFSCSPNPGRYYGKTFAKLNDLVIAIRSFLNYGDAIAISKVRGMNESETSVNEFCKKYHILLNDFGRRALKDESGEDIMIKRTGTVLVLWSIGLNKVNDNASGDDIIRIIDLSEMNQRANPVEEKVIDE